jgi:uncharacterized protein YegP (UPF0339 family)
MSTNNIGKGSVIAKGTRHQTKINMATKQGKFRPGVHVFKIKDSLLSEEGYIWHIVADNGEIVACSQRTYATRTFALNSIRMLHDVFRFDFDGKYFNHEGLKIKINKTWQ